MKLRNFIKLFSFVGFLVLSACFVPKAFAEDYKGIDYTINGSTLVINRDIDDEQIRIEFAKILREERPDITVIQTPLFRYTLGMFPLGCLPNGKCYAPKGSAHLPVSVTWELNEFVTGKPEEEKLKSRLAFIIFDTVDEYDGGGRGGGYVHRRDGDPELYLTKSGRLGVRKQETCTYYSPSPTRDAKRRICEFYVNYKITSFFKRISQLVSNKELFVSSGCKVYRMIILPISAY